MASNHQVPLQAARRPWASSRNGNPRPGAGGMRDEPEAPSAQTQGSAPGRMAAHRKNAEGSPQGLPLHPEPARLCTAVARRLPDWTGSCAEAAETPTASWEAGFVKSERTAQKARVYQRHGGQEWPCRGEAGRPHLRRALQGTVSARARMDGREVTAPLL